MKIFLENNNESLNTLKQYVPIVSRVHGKLHPEIKDVEKVFNELLLNINANSSLESNFSNLRKITNNYLIPSDVCESYEAVYNLLKEIDNNYLER